MSILSENVRLGVCAKPKGLLLALTDLRSAQIGSAPGRTVEMRWPLKVPPCPPLPPGIHYSCLGSPDSGPASFLFSKHGSQRVSVMSYLCRHVEWIQEELYQSSPSHLGQVWVLSTGLLLARPAKGRQLSQDSSWLQLTECTQGRRCT